MPKVRIWADVSESLLRGLEREAEQRGETVEHLLEHTVKALLEEMEDEENQPPDPSLALS